MAQPLAPSAGALVVLFAGAFVRPPHVPAAGFKVPCQSRKVDPHSLATMVCATTLWNLREQGLVTLDIVERKVAWVFRLAELEVHKTSSVEGAGVEGMLLTNLPRRSGAPTLPLLWRDVVRAALQEVVDLGCIAPPDDQLDLQRFFNRGLWPTYDCARIATFTAAADDLSARWRMFRSREQRLYELLVDTCRDTLAVEAPSYANTGGGSDVAGWLAWGSDDDGFDFD